jgi:hypothetical protein
MGEGGQGNEWDRCMSAGQVELVAPRPGTSAAGEMGFQPTETLEATGLTCNSGGTGQQ